MIGIFYCRDLDAIKNNQALILSSVWIKGEDRETEGSKAFL